MNDKYSTGRDPHASPNRPPCVPLFFQPSRRPFLQAAVQDVPDSLQHSEQQLHWTCGESPKQSAMKISMTGEDAPQKTVSRFPVTFVPRKLSSLSCVI